ncbi:MAG: D-aminoacyl-tRNA deacylase [Candidatus Thermoplasmatota archaeon]|nr:D-aminoacyl-tRNA deacylase [Candidatus Thermoplasmatota archaeon]
MTIVIISSTEDEAGSNIKKRLLALDEWESINTFFNNPVYQHQTLNDIYMVSIPDKTIYHENLDNELHQTLQSEPSQLIFISRHRSKSGEPTLSTHPIGNYADALYGGRQRTIIPSMPRLMTSLLHEMETQAKVNKLPHKVTFEVTHHGPFLKTPTLFAEVGSTLGEWKKEKPARVVALALLTVLHNKKYEYEYSKETPVLLGIGGGHYAPRFTTVVLKKNVSFGHMIPSYHVKPGHIDKDIIKKALQATPDVSGIYLDRKALSKASRKIFSTWCEELNIPLVSSKQFKDL